MCDLGIRSVEKKKKKKKYRDKKYINQKKRKKKEKENTLKQYEEKRFPGYSKFVKRNRSLNTRNTFHNN